MKATKLPCTKANNQNWVGQIRQSGLLDYSERNADSFRHAGVLWQLCEEQAVEGELLRRPKITSELNEKFVSFEQAV